MKSFARKWLLPPGISRLFFNAPPSVKRLWGWRPSEPELVELSPSGKSAASLDDLRVVPHGEIVWVETEKLRKGGRAFTWQQNHHVRYLKDGIESYRKFFELHQPRDQFEALMLDVSKVGDFSPVQFPRIRDPWSFEVRWDGENGMGPQHGYQGHGPITETKLLREKERLDAIRDSVAKRGFGQVKGDFKVFGEVLVDDSEPGLSDYRVCMTAGLHRTSLLAHLGWPIIPMMPLSTMPWREVRLSDVARWPGVLDGTFSEEAARAYFLAHFRDPTEELLAGW